MDINIYKDLVREGLHPYFYCRPGYLIQDNFSAHVADAAVQSVYDIGADLDFVPAGYTAALQPMDYETSQELLQGTSLHETSQGLLQGTSTSVDYSISTRGQTNSSQCYSVGSNCMGYHHSSNNY
jgi:hypothetical protein